MCVLFNPAKGQILPTGSCHRDLATWRWLGNSAKPVYLIWSNFCLSLALIGSLWWPCCSLRDAPLQVTWLLHLQLHLRAELTHDAGDIETPKSVILSPRGDCFWPSLDCNLVLTVCKQLFLHNILSESRCLKCTSAPTAFKCRTMEQTNKPCFAGAVLLSGH